METDITLDDIILGDGHLDGPIIWTSSQLLVQPFFSRIVDTATAFQVEVEAVEIPEVFRPSPVGIFLEVLPIKNR